MPTQPPLVLVNARQYYQLVGSSVDVYATMQNCMSCNVITSPTQPANGSQGHNVSLKEAIKRDPSSSDIIWVASDSGHKSGYFNV